MGTVSIIEISSKKLQSFLEMQAYIHSALERIATLGEVLLGASG